MATMAEAKRATGNKRQRPASMEVVETTPISRTIRQLLGSLLSALSVALIVRFIVSSVLSTMAHLG